MRLTQTAAPLGARVDDLDVRTVTDVQWRTLNDWFCTHHVLSFPNQTLTPEEHMAFAQRWGALVQHPYAGLQEYPNIIELTNVGKRRDINQHWHSDMTYNEQPPLLTMLYAHSAPKLGGDTAFANQVLAFEALSPGLQSMLRTLQAEHTVAGLAAAYKDDKSDVKNVVHPVVRTLAESDSEALYVCRAFTHKFVGWSRQDSAPLLDYLYRHSVREEFQARHRWQAGDLVMWDNRALLHFAVHDHAEDEPRQIHRLQVEGPVPA